MSAPDSTPRFIQREVVLLAILALVASVAFILTREVAQRQQATNLSDAAAWYAIGEAALDAGQAERAVASLRQATSRNRDDRRYTLTLARALAANGQSDEARAVLLGLREGGPDDPDVNIELARLAVRRQDVNEALRFYQSALYGIWPPGREGERSRLRVELIRMLLQREERERALSEVVALSTNLPDDAPSRIEAGRLFLAAGDPERALDQFGRALQLTPGDGDALAGAGEAAFARADYAAARRYLSQAPELPERLQDLRAVARLVLEQDPLEPRLPLATRRARLVAAVERASARLEQCAASRPAASASLEALQAELTALAPTLELRALRDQPEQIDHGLDVVYRVERAAADSCGAPTAPEDRALLRIGERHRGAS
ncbi:MAG: tetratricopeptide repeat protein [Vicinamibacterales bacterium]